MTVLWDAYRTALPSIAAAVGRTPLVKLNRVTAGVRPPTAPLLRASTA